MIETATTRRTRQAFAQAHQERARVFAAAIAWLFPRGR